MTLDELGRCLRTAKASRESSPSFLEAIERSSDENLISKYLLFLFRNDIELLNSVLRKSHPKESVELESIDNSCTEFAIAENKRMDILIQARSLSGEKVLIVIENKVYSCEHSDQCRNYYRYCHDRYRGYRQYYLFLYPDFNVRCHSISDKHFVKITYTQLLDVLSPLEQRTVYEEDFMNLINNHLRSVPMDELTKLFVENYDQIKNKIVAIDKELDHVFDEFKDAYCDKHQDFAFEFHDSHRTLRFYKDIPTWWNGWEKDGTTSEERIFFYVELKCEKNLQFFVQRTLKVYSKNVNTKINRYVQSLNQQWVSHPYMDTFKVFDRVEICSDYPTLSSEWKQELFDKVTSELERLAVLQQEEANRYEEYRMKAQHQSKEHRNM